MINKVSLFSGIEAFDKALSNIGIEVNTLALSEIDKYAITSCAAIHNCEESLNLGSVTDIKGDEFKDVDLLTHGSPCTSFSNEGKKEGGVKDSGTKSSLMWETVRIVGECLPKVVIWENVPDLLNRRNLPVYEEYLTEMRTLGYTNHFEILKAINYDLPQNRRRIITISIRNDIKTDFEFPEPIVKTKDLVDILEENVSETFNLESKIRDVVVVGEMINGEFKCKSEVIVSDEDFKEVRDNNAILIKNGTVKGYYVAYEGDGIDFNRPESKTRRGRVQPKRSNTLLTAKSLGTYVDGKLRYFTPLEYWRLQGFEDQDYYVARSSMKKVHNLNEESLNNQLYKQAGNSIPVTMLEEVFKELYLK